jgi:glycerol-3-phosphate dehydrogenase
MRSERRKTSWDSIKETVFDIAVIGSGINGAATYHQLCSQGYRVLLVDKADFGGGTSQASAMFIWGGVLYLRNLELLTVAKFCLSRDRMIRDLKDWVRVCPMRYVPSRTDNRSPWWVLAGLHLYWMLGAFHRSPPRVESDFPERAMLAKNGHGSSLVYEEACLARSDARFVLHWILSHRGPGQVALNYCSLQGGSYDHSTRMWRLELVDTLDGTQADAQAKLVVNAAGVWTDAINHQFGIESPYKHVLSKGVFIGIARDPRHSVPLIFENRQDKEADCMVLIPWGPVALWGPTETLVTDLDAGYQVEPQDVQLLLGELNRHLLRPVALPDILSLRCGVRPLAVPRSFQPGRHTLDLTKSLRIHGNDDPPWISVYGGKITGSLDGARSVERFVRGYGFSAASSRGQKVEPAHPECKRFPGLTEPVVSARFAAEHERCFTLEDYLRRRTNISQWVPRGGLGHMDEHLPHLLDLARVFTGHNPALAKVAVEAYRRKVELEFDEVLARCWAKAA